MSPPSPIVDRILSRDFATDAHIATGILAAYAGTERERVWLASLKLADGSLDQLRSCVSAALVDFRDLVAMAEYPFALRLAPDASEEQQAMARQADAAQYEQWLGA